MAVVNELIPDDTTTKTDTPKTDKIIAENIEDIVADIAKVIEQPAAEPPVNTLVPINSIKPAETTKETNVIPSTEAVPATCLCNGDIYNCGDFNYHSQAQAEYECCLREVGKDVHRLDGNSDGVACESLP